MNCESELQNAVEVGNAEGIRDHPENLKAFNDVVYPSTTMEQKRAALVLLRKNGFKKTVAALKAWLSCMNLAS